MAKGEFTTEDEACEDLVRPADLEVGLERFAGNRLHCDGPELRKARQESVEQGDGSDFCCRVAHVSVRQVLGGWA
eukprot:756256-Hanusia_phi.AAC.7